MKNIKKTLSLLFLLLGFSTLQANVIFPFMTTEAGIYSLFGLNLIILGILIEIGCLYWMLRQSLTRIIIATLAMNLFQLSLELS